MSVSTRPRERPILFSNPMVRAILDGSKTQTRRVVKPVRALTLERLAREAPPDVIQGLCPYGAPGDLLWVREAWCYATDSFAVTVGAGYRADTSTRLRGDLPPSTIPDGSTVYNELSEDWPNNVRRWRPSIHMPKWAARIWLEVTDVRVQRVQEISEDDAAAEGSFLDRCPCMPRTKDRTPLDMCFRQTGCRIHGESFRTLWDSLNEKRGYGWDANPWVWAVTFKRTEAP